ncbi:hypothetical protein [Azospirillum canadense]|uniref:hypothetical protein n=1 Tax=Azospirillum canadense TaxID=403962 RepID=UPI0022276D71|nr:hypothetical protein [Azospirillum canadense]MCW2239776.1 hypothetical protein [Azospirillum canadense]
MTGVWCIPTALALLSLLGLAAAILGDGVWHWICWAGLSIPLLVCAAKLWRQWPRAMA